MSAMEDDRINTLREAFWKKIRTHQQGGGAVRNELMAERFGGVQGTAPHYGNTTVCLIGLYSPDGRWGREMMQETGIHYRELLTLEAGFENWTWPNVERDDPLYKLGREIGQQLEDEERPRPADKETFE